MSGSAPFWNQFSADSFSSFSLRAQRSDSDLRSPDRTRISNDRADQRSGRLRCLVGRLAGSDRKAIWIITPLLLLHAFLLGCAAREHSPTMLEPAFLAAGLYHQQSGRFDLFRVNPPLVRTVASLPVSAVGYQMNWSRFVDSPGARPEFNLGAQFVQANGERSLWLFTVARWACIPFCLLGGVFCFLWSRELWGHGAAGLLSATLWCFDANILAHGSLITTDCAAAALGVGAAYYFWRWLKHPTWHRALAAGVLLGLAELTKLTWLILFGLWPILWGVYSWRRRLNDGPSGPDSLTEGSRSPTCEQSCRTVSIRTQLAQLAFLLAFAVYLINLGYGYQGSFTKLKNFSFVSHLLTGDEPGVPGNRFKRTWLGEVRVPLPKSYVLGLDVQRRDLEDYGRPSFLAGEWKHGGWWYYYVYGWAVKTPHGTQILISVVALMLAGACLRRWPTMSGSRSHLVHCPEAESRFQDRSLLRKDLLIVLAPAIAVLVVVSSQTECNEHFRYVFPAFGFVFVFTGAAVVMLPRFSRFGGLFIILCLGSTVQATASNYPHNLTFFNALAGGDQNGHRHLRGSSLGWGHDLLRLREWLERQQVDPARSLVLLPSTYDIRDIGVPAKTMSIKAPQRVPNTLDRERYQLILCHRSVCPECGRGTCAEVPGSPKLSVCWCIWSRQSGF